MPLKLPDVLYVVRSGEENEELRYSLRSLVNVPHGRVFIAGYMPSWVTNCTHVAVDQRGSKFENSTNNLICACRNAELSDDFIYMNDDFFVMKQIDEVRPYYGGKLRGLLTEYIKQVGADIYATSITRTLKVCERLGIPEPLNYELHVPMMMNKRVVLDVMAKRYAIAAMQQRSLFGNFANVGGEQIADVKVRKTQLDVWDGAIFLSTTDESFNYGCVGNFVRSQFAQRCQYEVAQ